MENAYESARQKVIPAVLLYASWKGEILMLHKKDHWNGLGGKLDLGESPLEAAVREFHEEAGALTTPSQWKWTGQLYFPNFKPRKNEDWWVTVFTADLKEDQARTIQTEVATAEGTLHWIKPDALLALDLWDGDAEFLPHVLKRSPFEGTLFYNEGRCVRKEVRPI